LIGCFLTDQIITNTLLAAMYSLSSVVILFQWFYYTYYYEQDVITKNESAKNIAKTTGLLGGACCCLALVPDSMFDLSFVPMAERRRLRSLTPNGRAILGATLGWIMAFIYVFSRGPQMYKSVTTKEVEDLSMGMFICTFFGNLTQMLSMVIKHLRELDMAYFKRTAPWMINAGLCAVQDLIIVFLIYKYAEKRELYNSQELQPLMTPDKVASASASNSSYLATAPTPKNNYHPGGGVYKQGDCKV